MSTSYENSAAGWSPVVETFPYHDALDLLRVDPDLEPPTPVLSREAESAKVDEGPHASQEEMSRLIAEAHRAGLVEGERQAAALFQEELSRERKRIADLLHDFQHQRKEYYSKVEIELLHLALAIAAKILHREAQVDRMVVAGLVKVMLERFQQNTKVVVRIRPEDAETWRHYFRDQTDLQVVEDLTLEPKACVLETELGSANLGLDAQLKEVEQGFFDLLARRPETK